MRLRLVLLMLVALLCCGCYAHDTTVTMNRDGSGTVEVTAGINKAYERGEVAAGRLAVDSDIARVVLNSFQATSQDLSPDWKPVVAPWDDGSFAGAKLTLSFTNVAMLQAQLKKLLALTQDSGRDDLFSDMQARQVNDQIEISAGLSGQEVTTDNGGPLPSGAEGVGRISWAVTLPQIDSSAPTNYAARNGNLVRWSVPLTELKPGTSLTLTTRGELTPTAATTGATALPTAAATAPATALATALIAASAAPTSATAAQPTALVATALATTTSSTAQPAATTPTATNPPVVAPTPATLTQVARTATPLAAPTIATATALPTQAGNATQQPRSALPTITQVATAFTPTTLPPVAAVGVATLAPLPTAQPAQSARPAATDQAFVPLIGAQQPTALAESVATPAAAEQVRRSPYRYLPTIFLLICSGLCFSYVILRRTQQRRVNEK